MKDKLKELTLRTITGLVIVGSIVGFSVFGNDWMVWLLFLPVSILGIFECTRIAEKINKDISKGLIYTAGILMYILVGWSVILGKGELVFPIIGFICSGVFVGALFLKKEKPLASAIFTIWPILYVAMPLSILTLFKQINIILPFFVFIWASDVFAYIIGSLIGKHKLFERWSPSKSWEGAIGGVLMSVLFACIWAWVDPNLPRLEWMLIAFVSALSGIFGDLVESMAKREVHIKDSGHILPGHGGILDRFDSVLIAAPILYLVLSVAKPELF